MVSPKRILVIQLRRIGDCLLTTPLIRALRRRFPEAALDFLVEPASFRVVQGNPNISEILLYNPKDAAAWIRNLRARRYDWVLDGLSNPRSALLTLASGAETRVGFSVPFWKIAYNVRVQRPFIPEYASISKLRLLEAAAHRWQWPLPPENPIPEFYASAEERGFAKTWRQAEGIGTAPVVILAPAHRRPVRRWGAGGFARLSQLLRDNLGARIFAVWGPGEENQIREITRLAGGAVNPLPPTTLGQMAAILEQCALLIANDNGPKHLATAVGARTLTLYGPTRSSDWDPPRDPRHRFLGVKGLGCLGCNLNRCPYGHECMEWMSPGEVFEAARGMLSEPAVAGV
jgi:ADP-heptose:LPS heptosyltransferase